MPSIRRSPSDRACTPARRRLQGKTFRAVTVPWAGGPTAALSMMPAIHRTRAPCGARTGRACAMHDARCSAVARPGQDTTGSMRRAVDDVQRNNFSRRAEQNATCDVTGCTGKSTRGTEEGGLGSGRLLRTLYDESLRLACKHTQTHTRVFSRVFSSTIKVRNCYSLPRCTPLRRCGLQAAL
jgi:hypothetical protein